LLLFSPCLVLPLAMAAGLPIVFFSLIGLFFQHPCFVRLEPSYSHLHHQLSPAPADP
jgi:hypothetical protein